MKGHKLVTEDHAAYTIRHPDGTDFKIAKAPLSLVMHSHIAKLPRVEHDFDGSDAPAGIGAPSPSEISEDNGPAEMAGGSPQPEATTRDDSAPAQIGAPPPTDSLDTPAADGQGNSFGVMQSDQNPDLSGVVGTPATGPAPNGGTMPDLSGQYLSDMSGAMGEAKAANLARAKAEGKTSNLQATAAEQYAQVQKDADNAYQTKLAELNAKNDDLYQQVSNTKIDPTRLWSSASTGTKMAALAGILLSGIGSGLTGQPNMAMGVINKAIDTDIDAQKSNLAAKQSLLHYNLEKTHDLTAAQAETRLNLLAVFKGQVDAAAAKQGSAVAMANAQGLNAQIDAQMAGIKHEVATQRAMWSLANQPQAAGPNADPNDIDPQTLRKSFLLGKAGFPQGVPEKAQAQAMDEYGNFKRTQGVMSTLDDNFNTMEQNHGVGVGTGPLATEKKKRYEAAANITMTQVDHELAGRVTETTLQALKDDNTPRWGDSPETLAQKRNNIKDAIKAANAKDAKGYGTLMTYGLMSPDNPYITPSSKIKQQVRSR